MRKILRDAGWSVAIFLGIYEIVSYIADAWDEKRMPPVTLERPWPLLMDGLQILALICVGKVIYMRTTMPWDPYTWHAWAAIGLLATRVFWEWRWGSVCWPRRTALGKWIDKTFGWCPY